MAFSYNTATDAETYMTGIAGWLPSQTGWSLEAQWTSGTTVCDVYKSAAATNGNIDFYVYVMRQTSSTTLIHFLLSEAYDDGAKTATYIMQAGNTAAGSSSAYTTDSSCRNPGAYSLTATSGNTAPNWIRFDITGLSQWGCHAFDDGVWFTGKTGITTGFYFHAGYFNSMVYTPGTNDPVPLGAFWNGTRNGNYYLWPNNQGVYGNGTTDSINGAAFTRWAMNPSTSTATNYTAYNGKHGLSGHAACFAGGPARYGPTPNATNQDKYQAATPGGSVSLTYLMSVFSKGATDGVQYGWVRGRAKNCVSPTNAMSAAWGDTITVSGETYRYLGSNHLSVNFNPHSAWWANTMGEVRFIWVKE